MRRDAFVDRAAAGRELAAALETLDLRAPVVLGLPRGGVVVAAEVARVLATTLDVLVVRKVGHPQQPELGLGAVTEDGEAFLDEEALRHNRLRPADLAGVVAAEQAECRRRTAAYRGDRPAAEVSGRTALVVDDGVATGVTALAALAMLRRQGASRLVFAAPVGPADSVQRLREMADDVVVPWVPHPFGAVSRFYGRFEQTSDAEVRRLLAT